MAGDDAKPRSGLNKAAAFMLMLDEPVLASVLKHLNSEEVKELMQHYETQLATAQPAHDSLLMAGQEFLQQSGRDNPSNHFRSALSLAFGDEAADELLRDDRWRAVAEQIEPKAVAELLVAERPQAVAITLSQLPSRYAAEVLSNLPEQLRTEAVERIARSDTISGPALDALLRAIEQNLASRAIGENRERANGVQRAAAVLSQLDSETADAIVQRLRESDASNAEAIQQQMIRFTDLLRLESRDLQRLLAETKPERLALALKGLSSEQRESVFAALPETVGNAVKEELEAVGRVPLREVQAARNEMANLALQLDREGKIRLRGGQDMVS